MEFSKGKGSLTNLICAIDVNMHQNI